jgi:Rho termination factor, N-terminal domain
VSVPTNTQQDIEPQRPLLNAVRESQAAVIDVVRAWTEIGEQLTRDLRLPVTRVDLAEAVDRMFDVAEQTLAVQRQFALTVAGATTRQLETAVDTTVEAVEATPEEAPKVEPPSKAEAPKVEPPSKAEPPKREARPDRRSYEERSIEELRERARELEIEGRSSMSKDELISALRRHSR